MFPTYLEVELPVNVGIGVEDHLPGFLLRQPLAEHVGVVGDEDLDVRLVVHVLESPFGYLVLHRRHLDLVPLLAREPLLHTDSMYHFIISRMSNGCVVLTKRCNEDSPITPS